MRADKTGLAAMTADLEAPFRTTHHPGLGGKIQRMAPCRAAADLPRLAPPHHIMTMARTDQRMGNLMKDGIADMIILGMPHIMPRQRDLTPAVIALAGTPPRIVEPHCPAVKTMFAHQNGGGLERRL